jgi:hypothetical protein
MALQLFNSADQSRVAHLKRTRPVKATLRI